MKQKIVLIAAVAAGLVAAVLTRFYLSAKDSEIAEMKARFEKQFGVTEVLCFSKDIPGGTIITDALLKRRVVPAAGLKGKALTIENLGDVIGRKVLFGRKKYDVLFWADIEGGNPRTEGLAASVKKGMRAVSINASGAAAVSGMVNPNDHVDVIGTFAFPGENGNREQSSLVTCTILQNVLVLATGRTTAKMLGRDNNGNVQQGSYSTVTLEVTPREAEMLAFAEQMRGRLSLSLRNRSDVSYERELPKVDFEKIQSEIEELNLKRQQNLVK